MPKQLQGVLNDVRNYNKRYSVEIRCLPAEVEACSEKVNKVEEDKIQPRQMSESTEGEDCSAKVIEIEEDERQPEKMIEIEGAEFNIDEINQLLVMADSGRKNLKRSLIEAKILGYRSTDEKYREISDGLSKTDFYISRLEEKKKAILQPKSGSGGKEYGFKERR